MLTHVFFQSRQTSSTLFFGKETGLTIIASLNYMQGHIWADDSAAPWHGEFFRECRLNTGYQIDCGLSSIVYNRLTNIKYE